MPLLVLLLLAVLAGTAVFLAVRPKDGRRGPVAAPDDPAVDAARAAGEHAGDHPRLRAALTDDPEQATGLGLTLALVAIIGGGLILAALALVIRHHDGLLRIDSSVANWGDRHATGASTSGLKLVTDLGATWLVVIVAVLVALVEARRTASRWMAPFFLLLVIAGDKLLNATTKGIVDRARPTLNPIADTLGPSFPSGHTSTAAAFWAAVALIAGRWCGRRGRAVLTGLAVGIAVGVAASRVLLDVHWLTDVLGGLALGWAWFAACAVAFGGRLLRFGAGSGVAARAAAGPPHDAASREA